jgi:hypothetical protein
MTARTKMELGFSSKLSCQCFFSPGRVVKIVCFSFEVVLQTTEHIMIYPILGRSSEVIALHPTV